ncbi:GvpL/GvpF family gas vesicle protein [Corallococcus sp. CA047B]|uniref:GvpL/GvpF family gas vesicle protein n=1 Tax=Corallococcus sp. CA047B TaxID=2316729 RepID=UPI000EA26A79|nr:GvpL/GvpF family gas vesicle protein [Corallococcus sp. CA047B]RKH17019.1 GvpL/GvpF family gas vesicle protein [Corallococcus sp. CA047B]
MATKQQAEVSRGSRARYVYAILRAAGGWEPELAGLGTSPVRTVREDDLVALVSDAAGLRVAPTRSHLLTHQRVADAVLREHTVVPVAFGTVLPSEERVREVLRTAHAPLVRALDVLEGRVELGLKVYCHRDALTRRLEEEAPELARRPSEPEEDHEQRMELALLERTTRDMGVLRDGLGPLVAAAHESAPLGERMLLNAAFLVDRAAVAAFEARLRTLAARTEVYAYRFSGPWPGYSFVDVRLGVETGPAAVS